MPGVSECLQELVSSLDGELTAMAASPKQTVEVLETEIYSTQQINHSHR